MYASSSTVSSMLYAAFLKRHCLLRFQYHGLGNIRASLITFLCLAATQQQSNQHCASIVHTMYVCSRAAMSFTYIKWKCSFNECEWLLVGMERCMLCLNNSLAMIYGIYDDNINTYMLHRQRYTYLYTQLHIYVYSLPMHVNDKQVSHSKKVIKTTTTHRHTHGQRCFNLTQCQSVSTFESANSFCALLVAQGIRVMGSHCPQ